MTTLPTSRVQQLAPWPEQRRWLVEGLWADQGVGVIGGEPKSCKSFLALDLAVAVASGAPCLRRFAVPHPGPVLIFPAEDAPHVVRSRLEGIAAAAEVPFPQLDIQVITAPTVRLDVEDDRLRLRRTVEKLRPSLLVLDPFVRLHRIDENAAADVAPLLAFLRHLQRNLGVAVLLVHHAKKAAASARPGQALRGSSELHAWGDSNLYLRRLGPRLQLAIEHRAAVSSDGLALDLVHDGDALALQIVNDVSPDPQAASPSIAQRIELALAGATSPLNIRQLRTACRARTASICDTIAALTAEGRVIKSPDGYLLAGR
jgi:AAA domain